MVKYLYWLLRTSQCKHKTLWKNILYSLNSAEYLKNLKEVVMYELTEL